MRKASGQLRLDPERKQWVITTTPDVAMHLKRIFPRLNQARSTELSIKDTPEVSNDLEWALRRYPMDCPDLGRLKRAAGAFRKSQARLDAIHAEPPLNGRFPMVLPPRPYQVIPTELYLEQGFLLLGDVMGVGKTPVGIASFTQSRTLPALVVVKSHLVIQWTQEIAKFIPSLRVHVIKKKDHYKLPPAEVYIITYRKLDAWWGLLARKIRSIVFDEMQELRCMGSAQYVAAKHLCEETPYRLGLTGTPIHNFGDEIWPLYNLLAPDQLGTREEFLREWCVSAGSNKHQVSDTLALGQYLRNRNLFLRRTSKDVGREIPPITRIVQEIDFDQKLFSQKLGGADELALRLLGGTFLERGQAAREFDLQLRQATGLAKAPYVAELVRMLVESGLKVLLSGWHRAVYDLWTDRLKDLNPVFFTGHETPAQKEASKRAFIEGRSDVFVMSNRSGSGTNGLQHVCHTVVIGELDWCDSVHDQVITRVARDGQESPVNVYMPVASVGSDPTMAEVLGLKSAQFSGIIDLGENPEGVFLETDPHRLRQLAVNYLKARGIQIPVESLDLSGGRPPAPELALARATA